MSLASTQPTSIETLINKVDKNINLGMVVFDLNTGATIYKKQADKLFTPASNMKLFSNAAALLAFGPDYVFTSKLAIRANTINHKTLNGSVYITLPGDPSFTHQDLYKMLAKLKKLKIKHINGNIVLVSQNAYLPPYADGIVAKDKQFPYGAPFAPVILDKNVLTVTISPSLKATPPHVSLSAPKGSINLNNIAKTDLANNKCGVGVYLNETNQLTVAGCINKSQAAVKSSVAIKNPLKYMQDVILSYLTQEGITVNGSIVLGEAAPNAIVIAEHQSANLMHLIRCTLKNSDNLYAESLFLHTAAHILGKINSLDAAGAAVKDFLSAQTKISFANAVFIDGSGLSRKDKVTPMQTIELLRFLNDKFILNYEYAQGLPIGGRDGTLYKRFVHAGTKDLIRAKTGYMSQVMSLSGYLYTANGHKLAFTMYINILPGTKVAASAQYKTLLDTLCSFLIKQKLSDKHVADPKNTQYPVHFQTQKTWRQQLMSKDVSWRSLEYALRQEFSKKDVDISYSDHHITMVDYGSNAAYILSSLKKLQNRFKFGMMLRASSIPHNDPNVLFIKEALYKRNKPTWVLYGTTSS
jgi:serine-type D-Ala-D-Ala carboxypeptidase/endopeptidase (penicillin-binding protein 4)